ncbi:MAG: hypothetical protein NC132_03455 [Corallococcus sp.]|nr:hypothetical protein [Corallococcus sp.]MCM1359559.1 hypothetical protein [Corallococcus sp.]MCM1395151.1 hypothetical protein [Corallococcus sp.]
MTAILRKTIILLSVLAAVAIFAWTLCGVAFADASKNSLEQFLNDNGVEVPDKIKSVSGWEDIVEEYIAAGNPTAYQAINHDTTYEFFKELSQKVFYSTELATYYSSYELQDSLVQNENGQWVSSGGYYSRFGKITTATHMPLIERSSPITIILKIFNINRETSCKTAKSMTKECR